MIADNWTPPNSEYPPPKLDEPPLHRAARVGDHEALRSLVLSGTDIHAVFDMRLDPGAYPAPATPLMVAAGSGDGASAETVRLLLALGADPLRTVEGRFCASAADFAAQGLGWNYRPGGDAQRLQLLLDAGCPLATSGQRAVRVMFHVAESGDAARLRLMLRSGANPHPPTQSVRRVPRMPEGVSRAAESPSENSAAPSPFEIPLSGAALSGNAECIRILLAAGAVADPVDAMGNTPLALCSSVAAAEALLEAGVDTARRNQYGYDPLDVIAQGRRLSLPTEHSQSPAEVARALLNRGVDPNARDRRGVPRLIVHCADHMHIDPALIRVFAEFGARLAGEPAVWNCVSPLHTAAAGFIGVPSVRHADAIRELVALGADVEACDNAGRTPLMYAADKMNTRLYTIPVLVELGANVNAADHSGLTALMLATKHVQNPDTVVRSLLDLGADPTLKDLDGRTALDHALRLQEGNGEACRLPALPGEADMERMRNLLAARERVIEMLRATL